MHGLWWWWADRQLRPLRRARLWRSLLAAFALFQLGFFAYTMGGRIVGMTLGAPAPFTAVAYLWDLIFLPLTCLLTLALVSVASIIGAARRKEAATEQPEDVSDDGAELKLSRRQMLAVTAAAVPPLANIGTAMVGLSQMDEFRIRTIDVPLAQLPKELDGMTIAHVSDMHVGKFTKGKTLARIVEATNDLRADLVLLTGDLIDFALRDLPAAIDAVKKINPRSGLYMCEGNHDLFEDRLVFENTVKNSGVPLLINEAETVMVRGREVQLLGMKWGAAGDRRNAGVQMHMTELQPLREPTAFQILLAHHPHAFDGAAQAGIPLTLAGHTHGGQLMLTPRYGAGPAMFKYWSGLYKQRQSALIVSNGVGNWFPIRTAAPAEIVHVRLRTTA